MYLQDSAGEFKCEECGERWVRPFGPAGKAPQLCPKCGELGVEQLPEIPELPAELEVVFAAETRIATNERGVHLNADMQVWFARHGIVSREEQWIWEELFTAIGEAKREVMARRIAESGSNPPKEKEKRETYG